MRLLPSGTTITVNNPNDSGTGSLRDALIQANSDPGGDVIDFAYYLGGQTITLAGTELPPITTTVTIDGSTTSGNVIINGAQESRIFDVAVGGAWCFPT